MIRSANPSIDVSALETRVRLEAKRAGERALLPPAEIDAGALAQRMRYVRELLADANVRLENAAERSAPRSSVPPRLTKLGPLGSALVRAMNYAFKAQRESDAELRAAIRGATAALGALADVVEQRK
jgi:hypothetical protein